MVILTMCKPCLCIWYRRILSGHIKIRMQSVNRIRIALQKVLETRRILEDFLLVLLGELFDNRHEPVKLVIVNRVILRLVGTILVVVLDEDEVVDLALDSVVLEVLDGPLEL